MSKRFTVIRLKKSVIYFAVCCLFLFCGGCDEKPAGNASTVGTDNVVTATITNNSGKVLPNAEITLYRYAHNTAQTAIAVQKSASNQTDIFDTIITITTDQNGKLSVKLDTSAHYYMVAEWRSGTELLAVWSDSIFNGVNTYESFVLKTAKPFAVYLDSGLSGFTKLDLQFSGSPLVYATDSVGLLQISAVPQAAYDLMFTAYSSISSATPKTFIVNGVSFENRIPIPDTLNGTLLEAYSYGCLNAAGLACDTVAEKIRSCSVGGEQYNNETDSCDSIDELGSGSGADSAKAVRLKTPRELLQYEFDSVSCSSRNGQLIEYGFNDDRNTCVLNESISVETCPQKFLMFNVCFLNDSIPVNTTMNLLDTIGINCIYLGGVFDRSTGQCYSYDSLSETISIVESRTFLDSIALFCTRMGGTFNRSAGDCSKDNEGLYTHYAAITRSYLNTINEYWCSDLALSSGFPGTCIVSW